MDELTNFSPENVTYDAKHPYIQSTNSTEAPDETDLRGDIPKAVADDIIFAIECVAIPILVVFGIVGSILSLIVLSHRKLRSSSTTVLLIGLAISDGMFLVTTIIRKPTCIISRFDPDLSYKYYTLSFQTMYYTNVCFSRVSTLLVTVISSERLIAVLYPLKVRLLCTRRRMIMAVIFVFVFTFGALALIPVQYEVIYKGDTPILNWNEFYHKNKVFFDMYNRYLSIILLRWLPKCVVVICNVIIITSLWKRRMPADVSVNQTSTENSFRTQRKVTIMLVTVAVVFVLALLPGDAFLVTTIVVDGFTLYGKYNNLFLVLSDVSLAFEIMNSSINFVIYMVLNSTFSNTYFVLFCPCLSRSKRLVYSATQSEVTSSSRLETLSCTNLSENTDEFAEKPVVKKSCNF